jgi:AcrR family transcriptional regulator
MVHKPDAVARREERAALRKDQVLDAAGRCFRANGFHSASIRQIADGAGVSMGNLYQIFENKDAIIVALCRRDFERIMLQLLAIDIEEEVDIEQMIRKSLAAVDLLIDPDIGGLLVQTLAETERNPKIKALLSDLDSQLREQAHKILRIGVPQTSSADIMMRVEMWMLLVHGSAIRVAISSREAHSSLRAGIEKLIRHLFQPCAA